jgi:hypothetical protein
LIGVLDFIWAEPYGENQIGMTGPKIFDLCRFEPGDGVVHAFGLKYLVQKERMDRVQSREYGTSENCFVGVDIEKAFVNFDIDPRKLCLYMLDPYPLEQKWRIKTQEPFERCRI